MIEDTDKKKNNTSEVSSCEQAESVVPSSSIDNTDGGSRDSEVSSHVQVQMSYDYCRKYKLRRS